MKEQIKEELRSEIGEKLIQITHEELPLILQKAEKELRMAVIKQLPTILSEITDTYYCNVDAPVINLHTKGLSQL